MMQSYIVTAIAVGFGPGSLLALDKQQAARRAHAVREATDNELAAAGLDRAIAGTAGIVMVERRVEFKRGERVTVVAGPAVNKALLAEIAPAGSAEARAAEDAAAAAKAEGTRIADAAGAAHAAEAKRRERIKGEGKGKKPAADKKPAKKPAGLGENETAADKRADREAERPRETLV